MDKLAYTISYIREYDEKYFDGWGKRNVIPGLLASLSEGELYDLYFSNESAPRLNDQIIKRISNDLKYGTAKHKRIITRLITESKKGKGRIQANAQVLHGIAEHLSPKMVDKVISMFISDKSKAIRGRAYRLINDNNIKRYIPVLISNWKIYRDYRVIYNLTIWTDDEFFLSNYKLFLEYSEPWLEKKVYSRLVKLQPEKLEEVKASNPSLFIYIAAINSIEVPSDDVRKIIFDSIMSDDISLLLWCAGKMGKWEILKDYDEQYESIKKELHPQYHNYK